MPPMLPKEIFLSHSSSDRQFADSIAEVLKNYGIPVWYSSTNVLAAQQWHDEIGEALKRCDWFIVLLSNKSVKSTWVKRELMFALDENRYANKIVPVLIETCAVEDLSWTLPSLQMVDFRDDPGQAFSSLLRIWGLVYKK
jgi:hypothetical protein